MHRDSKDHVLRSDPQRQLLLYEFYQANSRKSVYYEFTGLAGGFLIVVSLQLHAR
jgi:hypothetical protein